jgi:hypothetical protein
VLAELHGALQEDLRGAVVRKRLKQRAELKNSFMPVLLTVGGHGASKTRQERIVLLWFSARSINS